MTLIKGVDDEVPDMEGDDEFSFDEVDLPGEVHDVDETLDRLIMEGYIDDTPEGCR